MENEDVYETITADGTLVFSVAKGVIMYSKRPRLLCTDTDTHHDEASCDLGEHTRRLLCIQENNESRSKRVLSLSDNS